MMEREYGNERVFSPNSIHAAINTLYESAKICDYAGGFLRAWIHLVHGSEAPGPEHVKRLLPLLEHEDAHVRGRVAEIFEKRKSIHALVPLAERLNVEPEGTVRSFLEKAILEIRTALPAGAEPAMPLNLRAVALLKDYSDAWPNETQLAKHSKRLAVLLEVNNCLAGANLNDMKLDNLCLAGADLRNANLSSTSLRNSDLRGAKLRGARGLDQEHVSGARIDKLQALSFARAILGKNAGGFNYRQRHSFLKKHGVIISPPACKSNALREAMLNMDIMTRMAMERMAFRAMPNYQPQRTFRPVAH